MVSEQYKKVMTGLEDIMKYPWHDLGFYSCWLAQSYFYTSRSTRLLLMASAHTGLDKPVLHRRYALHAGEEKGQPFRAGPGRTEA